MRLEESLFIRNALIEIPQIDFPKTCINLGSGNVNQIRIRKPWVFQNIFDFLYARGCKTIHADMTDWDNVDRVIDLTDSKSLEFCANLPCPKVFVLANVLEHVPRNFHSRISASIYEQMAGGDYLIITVPHAYPFHPDPIDTMYRPTDDELKKVIPLRWLETAIVTAGSYVNDLAGMKPLKVVRKTLKPLWPFRRPKKYLSDLHRLTFLFRPYRIAIAIGRKE